MSMLDPDLQGARPIGESRRPVGYDAPSGYGWIVFASTMLLLAGVLNVIYGIAAISGSSFFADGTRFILSDLNTWGWITLIVGVLQVFACGSILAGGSFGRWFGVLSAGVSAIAALLAIPGYPLWSLAVFGLDLLVMYGLITYGGRPGTV